jgi:protein-disulfide isomerase
MTRNSWLLVLSIFFLMPIYANASDGAGGVILLGTAKAPLRMEVYSDFECPACRTFYREIVKQVLKDYAANDKVCVIYHEFPLALASHQYSNKAARYCEAAYRLGRDKAVKVVDALFAFQDEWNKDGNIEAAIAKSLSPADLLKIRTLLNNSEITKAIDQGISSGKSLKVTGTPTLFLYYSGKEKRVDNPHQLSYLTVKEFIEKVSH